MILAMQDHMFQHKTDLVADDLWGSVITATRYLSARLY